jgi:hypothetical protein
VIERISLQCSIRWATAASPSYSAHGRDSLADVA